jgi:PAS domain S-box-containing protein
MQTGSTDRGPGSSDVPERRARRRRRKDELSPLTPLPKLGPAGGAIIARAVLLGSIAGLIGWVVDGVVDALLTGQAIATAVLSPGPEEIWRRAAMAITFIVFVWAYLRVRRSERRTLLFYSAVEHAPDGIQLTTPDGRIVYSNAAVRDLYGFPLEHFLGRPVGELNVDQELAAREILPALRERGRWVGELEVWHADGYGFTIWLTAAALTDGRGAALGYVGIIRDMTERRRDHESLARYARELEEANRSRQLFLDIMTHDLLNPAGVVTASATKLLDVEPEPAKRRLIELLLRGGQRIVELCESATRYASMRADTEVELATLELGSVVRAAVADLDPKLRERSAFVSVHADRDYWARAHPLVVEVFANLLSNAAKYGPPGGPIDVELEDGGSTWVVAVRDRGDGVPDEFKQRIFTRFERAGKQGVKGSGLGLTIARLLVDSSRGEIWVEDNPGGGSVFKVRLPKAPEGERGAAAVAATAHHLS